MVDLSCWRALVLTNETSAKTNSHLPSSGLQTTLHHRCWSEEVEKRAAQALVKNQLHEGERTKTLCFCLFIYLILHSLQFDVALFGSCNVSVNTSRQQKQKKEFINSFFMLCKFSLRGNRWSGYNGFGRFLTLNTQDSVHFYTKTIQTYIFR